MLVITGVKAGTDPCDGRHGRAGWAGCVSAAAATAQIAINGTVAPVIAGSGIARITDGIFRANPRDGQKREGCHTNQSGADTSNHTSSRRLASRVPGGFFEEFVEPIHPFSTGVMRAVAPLREMIE